MTRAVLVVGAGLIGTSIGLALRDAAAVFLHDDDEVHLDAAVERGAGARWDGSRRVDLAVVAVPPSSTAQVVCRLLDQDVAATVSHVASTQADVQRQVETRQGGGVALFCGSHPMSGRETRGPLAARGDLFDGRPWAVCPTPDTAPAAVAAVRWLAERCGSVVVEMPAAEHDAAVALVSHLPQVSASALAAQLAGEPGAADATTLAGPGVQDSTRIAASDPSLWVDVLSANAVNVAPLVRRLAGELAATADALDALAAEPGDERARDVVRELLRRGAAGRALLPVKGRTQRPLTSVVVSVPDRPGELAAVLTCAAGAGINVEDVRVEHLGGRPRGLLELLVADDSAHRAREALSAGGWTVLGG